MIYAENDSVYNIPGFGSTMTVIQRLREALSRADALLHLSALGIITGILAGLTILLFRLGIETILRALLPNGQAEGFESLQQAARFALPVAGALVLGIIMSLVPRDHAQTGVVHVIDRLHNHRAHLPVRNFLLQFFGGGLALICGQSSGREGPAIHLGAAVNSLFGQWLKLPNNSLHLMVGCGSAAAIGAAFNTPLAGVIFAMEVIVLEYTITGFMPIILAAASGAVISSAAFGVEPAFPVPRGLLASLWELPLVVPLGLLIGATAGVFILIQQQCLRFRAMHPLTRASIAGLVTGVFAVWLPQIMGVGYDTISAILSGEFGLHLLVAIMMAKLVATAVSAGLGLPIGVISPSILIGGCIGAAFWLLGQLLGIHVMSDNRLFILLGMGAMMGALLNAPLAALTALLELSSSPHILMPAMVTIIVANLTNRVLFRQNSTYVQSLRAAGIRISSSPVRRALQRVGVSTLVDSHFLRRQAPLPLAELPPAKAARWLVVESDGHFYLYDLPRIHTMLISEEYTSQSMNIVESELPRRELLRLDVQSSLRDAWEAMTNSEKSAVFISGIVDHVAISGILTRDRIEDYYLNNSEI